MYIKDQYIKIDCGQQHIFLSIPLPINQFLSHVPSTRVSFPFVSKSPSPLQHYPSQWFYISHPIFLICTFVSPSPPDLCYNLHPPANDPISSAINYHVQALTLPFPLLALSSFLPSTISA